ncbi:hypothetical protein UFOVP1491_112 [uncultured Caudovirales phage]|uniref:Uncharacterized protein n=1 Tax=uncultured Caudovirales phage TaxID=2100421 RepID=A0A6J5PRY9_9CAUD|nr:hypothetical protein UFOVP485_9 [uncultured Caudovirales phage]CAB4151040.1 hypothetical protein UFOVP575_113 [uncultured Caudovirales phage]CAB4174423.1 hypothetical protein UFOVP963_47 [uncultured Caudovirales phage]CAB4179815.1 hypothetical protein UFOVP1032_112 [uncultured Caudovirales phage]CAB4185379.1 hypothetical protein UFOVP1125_28 [uncultured Caudovirales phage]
MQKDISPGQMLINSLNILNDVYSKAKKERNFEVMVAISDRMLMLFDKSMDLREYKVSNRKNKNKVVGFGPLDPGQLEEDDF